MVPYLLYMCLMGGEWRGGRGLLSCAGNAKCVHFTTVNEPLDYWVKGDLHIGLFSPFQPVGICFCEIYSTSPGESRHPMMT